MLQIVHCLIWGLVSFVDRQLLVCEQKSQAKGPMKGLTITELKAILQSHKLSVKGNKKELLERLQQTLHLQGKYKKQI